MKNIVSSLIMAAIIGVSLFIVPQPKIYSCCNSSNCSGNQTCVGANCPANFGTCWGFNDPVNCSGPNGCPGGCCKGGECSNECGEPEPPPPTATPTPTPTPTSIIRARAVNTTDIPLTCAEITSSTDYRDGNTFQLYLGQSQSGSLLTQSGSSYVSWSRSPNTYSIVPQSSATNTQRICLTDNTGTHFGNSSVSLEWGELATFDVAYSPVGPWFQIDGTGDAYAGDAIVSAVPAGASPTYFSLDDGPIGSLFPGMVTYGDTASTYDFDPDLDQGTDRISSEGWLVSSLFPTHDFYTLFASKLGNPGEPDNLTSPSPLPSYDPTKTVYYVNGDFATNGNWSIPTGQSYVFLVDGDLTLNGRVNLVGTGFIAFVVSGDINISPGIGTTFSSVIPVLEGIYLASGTLHTGANGGPGEPNYFPGAERFVGKGMFIAGGVSLERNLSTADAGTTANDTNAAELFIYNPELLIRMPDSFKDVPIAWEEVAP